jgi:hypothetical protein
VSCSGKDESCHSVRWSLGAAFLPRVSGGSSGDDPRLVRLGVTRSRAKTKCFLNMSLSWRRSPWTAATTRWFVGPRHGDDRCDALKNTYVRRASEMPRSAPPSPRAAATRS